ncbi:MAG: alcohol dehydrogenase catalytic domain-containing protein [Planctomycetaceae bacterium]|nr:alcohol dehydrogenase catalytic domain-containing protein [Planctomycetaceae bacterium]
MATMKAIVRTGLGPEQMFLQDVPIPEIEDHEALVRVKAVGVCGTDAHIWSGHVNTEIPVIVGHEFSGIVEKVGSRTSGVAVGDRIVSRLNIGVCGTCRNCLTGNPHMCEERTCPGFKLDGAYAEYIRIDAKQLLKLSDNVSFEEGAVVEPMAIVAHALLQRAKVEVEDVVVVYGPGPIGLIAMQMARIAGAAKVYMVGTNVDEPQRLPLAEKLGADKVFNAQKDDVEKEIRALNDGKGVDLVIDASGAPAAINAGIRLLRRQGRMCVLGLPTKREITVEWLTAAEKSLEIITTYSSAPSAWNMVVSMLGRGAIDAKSLISHLMPMADFKEVFSEITKGNAVKCVLIP